jgi:NADH-quinone oxidoreductase subunit C
LSSADDGATTTDETTEAADEATPAASPGDAVEEAVEVDERREAVVESLRSELGDALVGSHVAPGHDVWARVALESWVTAGTFARDGLRCHFFEFLSGIDWLPSPFGRDMDSQEDLEVHGAPEREAATQATGVAGGDTRFQLLARVHDPVGGVGVILKADLGDDPENLVAGSWVPVYAGAAWHERETWEMFGVTFEGHPNLAHLYLPGAFEGHPLRKDFPLLSRRVKPWPGIVDVEPMPGEEAGEDDEAADGGEA